LLQSTLLCAPPPSQQLPTPMPECLTTEIVVAAQNIPRGSAFTPDAWIWAKWPSDSLPPEDLLIRDPDQSTGRFTLTDIRRGEPILLSMLSQHTAPTPTPLSGTIGETVPVELLWQDLTGGPSPFDPNAWAVRIQLSATGGNGAYIFWVNGVRLPDISENQFTVEGKGCEPEKPVVGVTSGGQATSLELVIQSPLPKCQR
jgi:hypothetical protein